MPTFSRSRQLDGKAGSADDTRAARPGSRSQATRSADNVQELYIWVRTAILNGKMEPGCQINQAQLAQELGVSRTPLREALRMLQAEGLVVGELNQKMRVTAVTAEDIDSIYAARILLESFGLSITVPRMSEAETGRLQQTLKYMNAHDWTGDRAAWEVLHTRFHGLLVMHVRTLFGATLADTIASLQLRAERYGRLYVSSGPQAPSAAAKDHARIVEAISAGATEEAIKALSEHLARTALKLLSIYAPGYEAVATNNAVKLAAGGGAIASVALAGSFVPDSVAVRPLS